MDIDKGVIFFILGNIAGENDEIYYFCDGNYNNSNDIMQFINA